MAVTEQLYTQAATWTAAQCATLVRSAFIDAGLMTEWYDSFLSGSMENRILEVQYDGAKTYGKTYYWFIFTGSSMYLALATGWNATTHVPTGTQYLDYYSTTTNAITNHYLLATWSASTSLTITRYQSAVDTNFSWFLMRNGSSSLNFHIAHSSVGNKIVPWVDLDKTFFHHFLICSSQISNLSGAIGFRQYLLLRRSYVFGAKLRGITNVQFYGLGASGGSYTNYPVAAYQGIGNGNNIVTNFLDGGDYNMYSSPFVLPVYFNNTNPAYTTDQVPIFTGMLYSNYLQKALPSDFGITFHYANNTMTLQDTFVVSSGSEEWEMIAFSNSGTITTGASPLFLARTV